METHWNLTLKTALPTIAANPTSDSLKVPTKEVNSSGADPPAAIKVAPATSFDMLLASAIASNAGTKNSSHTFKNNRDHKLSNKHKTIDVQRVWKNVDRLHILREISTHAHTHTHTHIKKQFKLRQTKKHTN